MPRALPVSRARRSTRGPAAAARLLPLAAALLSLLAAGPAAAQAAGDYAFGPTRGVSIPGRSLTGDADASGLELNPGQLGLLDESSLLVVGALSSEGAALPGRGAGLLYAAPLILHGSFGIGLQGLGATSASPSAPALGGHTKFQLGYGIRLGRAFGLGLAWGHVFGSAYRGTDTFDAGASYRLARAVALGLVVQDLGEPRPSEGVAPLRRVWSAELALRPLGSDRLEVAATAVHVEGDRWRALAPRFRLQARVADGLRLFAELETLARDGNFAFAEHADYRVTAGLRIDGDHLGATLAARTARPGVGDSAWGGGVLLRVSGERYPAVLERQHVERVSVGGIATDRDFLALAVRLRALAGAEAVAGVVLKIEDLELGLARIEELRDLIGLLRQRGKKVFAYAVSPSTREYYLASACDAIIVHPAGSVTVNGLAQNVTFYKKALDRLGVDVQLVRIAEYKGAMEPFILNDSSEPVRRNRNALLDDVFGRLVDAVVGDRRRAAAGRGGAADAGAAGALSADRVRALIDRGVFTPAGAQAQGLIDAVADEGEVAGAVGRALGRPGIEVRDPDPAPRRPAVWRRPRIAVVLVDGTIVDGASQELPLGLGAFAGAATLAAALEECRRDPSIAAVVLRVNSPGGSAFASDVMARAIIKVRAAGKPVVVSMGDYAASGGYYIAAPADLIFAEPSTITGSIGIFGYKADVQKLMTEVGLSVETYRRGLHADLMSPYRPWTDGELALMSEQLQHFYGLFLATVAEGRKSRGITAARADQLGRGQVWTGSQAWGVGLVDHRGGVLAAIDQAAALAHLAPAGREEEGDGPELEILPRPPAGLLQKLVGIASDEVSAATGAQERPALTAADLGARLLAGPGARAPLRLLAPLLVGGGSGVEARMPFELEIR